MSYYDIEVLDTVRCGSDTGLYVLHMTDMILVLEIACALKVNMIWKPMIYVYICFDINIGPDYLTSTHQIVSQ